MFRPYGTAQRGGRDELQMKKKQFYNRETLINHGFYLIFSAGALKISETILSHVFALSFKDMRDRILIRSKVGREKARFDQKPEAR